MIYIRHLVIHKWITSSDEITGGRINLNKVNYNKKSELFDYFYKKRFLNFK